MFCLLSEAKIFSRFSFFVEFTCSIPQSKVHCAAVHHHIGTKVVKYRRDVILQIILNNSYWINNMNPEII